MKLGEEPRERGNLTHESWEIERATMKGRIELRQAEERVSKWLSGKKS
jgi:hypothetical protein